VVRSEEEIQEILDRNKGAMYTLYNRELRKDTTLQGKIVMRITIAPKGNVTRCVILSSELGSTSLEQQLIALIKRIDFGNKPGVPAVTTKVPIEFFPR
jgi:TonB family protein